MRVYTHQGIYQESLDGTSNITLTIDHLMNGMYVVTSNGGNLITPTAVDICSSIPDNVKKNDVFFNFLIMNSASTNITLEPGVGVSFYPSGNVTLHKDKCYQLAFRIVNIPSSVSCYLLGYT
jgi:hypothetical protein